MTISPAAVASVAIAFVASFFAGCAAPLTNEKAIARAAAEPTGVEHVIRLTVRNGAPGVGAETGGFYLNSERNYRDPRSVNLILDRRVVAEFAAEGVTDLRAAFLDREVLVNGIVRRVRINWVDDFGRPTGEYYFQTQIRISSARQITLADSGKTPLPPPVLDIARAGTQDYLAADPDNPLRALYVERLQKRIDELYQQQLFSARFGSGVEVPPGRRIRFQLTVLADGRLAADFDEIRSQLRKEPELASIVLSVLTEINDTPEPFPEVLRVGGLSRITYEASFSIR